MSKFILLIIIVNLIVVIYNLYMWFKVGIENESLRKENDDLIYYLNYEYNRNIRNDKKWIGYYLKIKWLR